MTELNAASPLRLARLAYAKQIEGLRLSAETVDALVRTMLESGYSLDQICVEGGFTMEVASRLRAGSRLFDLTVRSE